MISAELGIRRRNPKSQKHGGRYKKSKKYPGLTLIRAKFYSFLQKNSHLNKGRRVAQITLSQIQWKFGVAQPSIYSWIKGLMEHEYILVEKKMINGLRHNVYVLLK